jgi:hypothetical protein
MPREAVKVQRSDVGRPSERVEAEHFAQWLEPIYDLNRRLLALLAEQTHEEAQCNFHVATSICDALGEMDGSSREQLACCPFLLLDASFNDAARWTVAEYPHAPRLHTAATRVLELARATCVLSWYLVRTDHVAAMLVLGLSAESAAVIQQSNLMALENIAARLVQHRWFRPRWHDRPEVWRRLIHFAQATPPRSVAVHGLQLFLGDLILERPMR